MEQNSGKKKLNSLLKDILKVGCIKGFRFFSMYLRGREELLLKVQNDQVPSQPINYDFQPNDVTNISNDQIILDHEDEEGPSSFSEERTLPREYNSIMLSKSTQRNLSGFHFLDIGLPPASPCETDAANAEHASTLFLLAAYSRYKSPYIWVRSNHHRLVEFQECHTSHDDVYKIQDSPLKLKSTSDWQNKDIKIWNILAEVICLNVVPSPRNPFEVDHLYFESLPLEDFVLSTGAMIHFLQRVLLHGDRSYHTKVSDDLNELMLKHFKAVHTLACSSPQFEPLRKTTCTGAQPIPWVFK